MLMVFFFLINNTYNSIYHRYYIDEFFQLDPLYRLLFSTTYLAFAAGLLVQVWQAHGINYIHIFEVDYKDRMNPY